MLSLYTYIGILCYIKNSLNEHIIFVGNHVPTSNLILSDKPNNTSTSYYARHKKLKDME
jgi:hypothetical protein